MAYDVSSDTKQLDKLEIINAIVGPIEPLADEAADKVRYDNLGEFAILTLEMVQQLCRSAENVKDFRKSVKENGELSVRCLKKIQEEISETLDSLN